MEVFPRRVVERRIGEGVGNALWTFSLVVLVGDEGAVVLPSRVDGEKCQRWARDDEPLRYATNSPDRESLGEGAELGELVVNSPALDETTRVGEEAEVVSIRLEFARLLEYGHLVSLQSTLDGCSEPADAGADDDDLDAGRSARRRARVVGERGVGLGGHDGEF